VWNYLQIDWSLGTDIQSAVEAARRDFGKPFFMEVMILSCWNIWKQGNWKIFQVNVPLLQSRDVILFMTLLFLFIGLKLSTDGYLAYTNLL
jgi:hypothetical protein